MRQASDKPQNVAERLDRIAEKVPAIIAEYVEASEYAHSPRDVETDENDYRGGKGTGHGDPTGNVGIDFKRREMVKAAAQEIAKAEALLDSAYSRLGNVFRSTYVPLRERMKAGERPPANVVRNYRKQETYHASRLSQVREWLREAG